MNKNLAKNISFLCGLSVALFCLIGKPAIFSRSQVNNMAFPEGVAINSLSNAKEIKIPAALKNYIHFETFDRQLTNTKLEAKSALFFVKNAARLIESNQDALTFEADKNSLDNKKMNFDFVVLKNDGSLFIQNKAERKQGKLSTRLYKFKALVFSDYSQIKALSRKIYVSVSNDKTKLLIQNLDEQFTVVLYDRTGSAYPIATEVIPVESVQALATSSTGSKTSVTISDASSVPASIASSTKASTASSGTGDISPPSVPPVSPDQPGSSNGKRASSVQTSASASSVPSSGSVASTSASASAGSSKQSCNPVSKSVFDSHPVMDAAFDCKEACAGLFEGLLDCVAPCIKNGEISTSEELATRACRVNVTFICKNADNQVCGKKGANMLYARDSKSPDRPCDKNLQEQKDEISNNASYYCGGGEECKMDPSSIKFDPATVVETKGCNCYGTVNCKMP